MTPETRPLAVVTGASSGIGYELARQFAMNDHDVFVAADTSLDAVVAEVERLGAGVQSLHVDLATYENVEALYAAITTTGRPVDVLALNAGVGAGGSFTETDLAEEIRLIELNVISTVHLAKLAAQDMVLRGQGRILFTSSSTARIPSPFNAVYGASKAFVHSFAQALRNELDDQGVSITAVVPGPTDTEFFERAGMQDTEVGTMDKDDPAQVAEQAFAGLMAGKRQVIAGSPSTRARTHAAAAMPDPAGARNYRKMSEPGSGQE